METDEINEIDGKYIVCYYLYGIKNRPDLYKKETLLMKKNNSNMLNISIDGEELTNLVIPNDKIKSITVSKQMITRTDEAKTENTENRNTKLIAAMSLVLSPSANLLYTVARGGNKTIGGKVDISSFYKIEIVYNLEEESRLVLQCYTDPKTFFEDYMNIYVEK